MDGRSGEHVRPAFISPITTNERAHCDMLFGLPMSSGLSTPVVVSYVEEYIVEELYWNSLAKCRVRVRVMVHEYVVISEAATGGELGGGNLDSHCVEINPNRSALRGTFMSI